MGRALQFGLIVIALGAGSGCMSCFNPVAGPQHDCLETCRCLPRMGRNHVYVFFMNGLDPANCCNLTGLRDRMQQLGFLKTYYGQPMHFYWFAAEIRRLRTEDCNAQIALVGSQYGANLVCSLAEYLEYDNVPIDLVVLLDGTTLNCSPEHRPENVERVVHLWSGRGLLKGKDYPGAENVCLADANPLGCGGHPETVERLALELSVLAAAVPVDDEVVPETAPQPQPVEEAIPPVSADWDFLRPRSNRPLLSTPAAQPHVQAPTASK